MPEGPQVFRFAEKLREVLQDATLTSVIIFNHPFNSATSMRDIVTGEKFDNLYSRVLQVASKGKRAVIVLEGGKSIMITFALAGKLEYSSISESSSPPVETASTMAVLSFSIGGGGLEKVYISLQDPQHLASATFDQTNKIFSRLLPMGFDPLHTIAGMREWIQICKEHKGQLVGLFITNQSIVAGVGNRYRSEIMHIAKIPPDARVGDLNDERLQILLITIYRVLKLASRGEYEFSVFGLTKSFPEGIPVSRVEIAKGVLVWTTVKNVTSARRVAKK